MTKDVGILILGLIVAAMPFLGFPGGIKTVVFVVAGLLIALLAFLIRGDFSLFRIERTGNTFVENDRDHSGGAMNEAGTAYGKNKAAE